MRHNIFNSGLLASSVLMIGLTGCAVTLPPSTAIREYPTVSSEILPAKYSDALRLYDRAGMYCIAGIPIASSEMLYQLWMHDDGPDGRTYIIGTKGKNALAVISFRPDPAGTAMRVQTSIKRVGDRETWRVRNWTAGRYLEECDLAEHSPEDAERLRGAKESSQAKINASIR